MPFEYYGFVQEDLFDLHDILQDPLRCFVQVVYQCFGGYKTKKEGWATTYQLLISFIFYLFGCNEMKKRGKFNKDSTSRGIPIRF